MDEADSLLIDEARVPLVITGHVASDEPGGASLAPLVASLVPGVHYATDEYGRTVELTDAGLERVERALGVGSLYAEGYASLLAEVNCALHAQVLLRRDVDRPRAGARVDDAAAVSPRVPAAVRHDGDGARRGR